ncbi:MAG: NAD(P)H-dependent oxidoreductase [Clostridia bacterium]|nr:NAD(P)H-dependent oxidoreductase [Clostridia bacterium]
MKKILFVDSCIKASESRTKKIATAMIQELQKSNLFTVETVVVDETSMVPLGLKEYKNRRQLLDDQKMDDPLFDYAKQFASADLIVIAAPFWDMSFPAKLKTYFENIAVAGFTFINTEDGNSVGVCKADKMVYITTRGMNIPDGHIMEQAAPYLKALTIFFGIKDFEMVSAYGLDVSTATETENRIEMAKQQAIKLAQMLIDREKESK